MHIDPKSVGAFSWGYRFMFKVRRYGKRLFWIAVAIYFAIAAYGRYRGATP